MTTTALLSVVLFTLGAAAFVAPVTGAPNPVAMSEAEYAAYGRTFSDPQGCLAHDTDGDGVNDVVPPNVSPWAKGNACMGQFLSYEEVIEGSKFLARTYPDLLQVIRLDQAYDNPEYRSAGLPAGFAFRDGTVHAIDRARRPLYLFKVTDRTSPIPEPERLHFVYAGGLHGPERAGVEGAVRAMEDLITWAASDPDKLIVEAPTTKPVPSAGETLERAVVYFVFPNPDGWHRGQISPVEFQDGSLNLNHQNGLLYQRYNGNGMDLNRDWPGVGYTYKPYSPASEPETRAYMEVLRGIRETISPDNPVGQRFAGGIDLHGQLTANAFSFTLLGAGQRDFRKNFSTVDQSLRAWEDQTTRLSWSPYIADENQNGQNDPGETCLREPVFGGNVPFCVADQWGTVIDTIGYQVSGALGDWIENEEIGLGGVGIDNEMSLSHLAPNSGYEPILEQMHVDGNKGLIYSQIASMLTETGFRYEPTGKLGYVHNPVRIEHEGQSRPSNPGLPAQNDLDVVLPCQEAVQSGPHLGTACGDATFALDGSAYTLEFDVDGPNEGVWNGGITATMTNTNARGHSTGTLSRISLQHFDEDDETWENAATSFVQAGSPDLYLPGGQIVTVNDPLPGRWRVRITNAAGGGPVRVNVDFRRVTAEESPGQAPFSASSMDFFDDLNRYIGDPADHAEAVTVDQVVTDPAALDRFDTVVVVNRIGERALLTEEVGLTGEQADAYFAALRGFAEAGGNLVLTDGALSALGESGVVASSEVREGLARTTNRGQAASYNFSVSGRGNVCNTDPLTADVCLPGTAGGNTRVAVEPTPLGFPPDGNLDNDADARMRQWWVQRAAWESGCGKSNPAECTSATLVGGQVGLGERHVGDGVVRVAGAMFPDPSYAPDQTRDMRFGLQSYALTFSAWQVFLNLVDYERPRPDLAVTGIATASRTVDGRTATVTATIANLGTDAAPASTARFVLDGDEQLGDVQAPAVAAGEAVEVSVPWPTQGVRGEHTIRVTADALDALAESEETNNGGTLTVEVRGNQVEDGAFVPDGAEAAAGTEGEGATAAHQPASAGQQGSPLGAMGELGRRVAAGVDRLAAVVVRAVQAAARA